MCPRFCRIYWNNDFSTPLVTSDTERLHCVYCHPAILHSIALVPVPCKDIHQRYTYNIIYSQQLLQYVMSYLTIQPPLEPEGSQSALERLLGGSSPTRHRRAHNDAAIHPNGHVIRNRRPAILAMPSMLITCTSPSDHLPPDWPNGSNGSISSRPLLPLFLPRPLDPRFRPSLLVVVIRQSTEIQRQIDNNGRGVRRTASRGSDPSTAVCDEYMQTRSKKWLSCSDTCRSSSAPITVICATSYYPDLHC